MTLIFKQKIFPKVFKKFFKHFQIFPILRYKNHLSITVIKNAKSWSGFYFCEISFNDVYYFTIRKTAQTTDIYVKIKVKHADIFSTYIYDFFNETIRSGKVSSILENAVITTVFKKAFNRSKENYRPVSTLTIISKIFEKIISKQIIKLSMWVSKRF